MEWLVHIRAHDQTRVISAFVFDDPEDQVDAQQGQQTSDNG